MHSVGESLKSAQRLLSARSPSARADVELLLAHVLQCERSFLIAHPEQALTESQTAQLESFVERRAKGEPIAYLIGTAWFCGRPFKVNEHVLVPRPETEYLAQAAIEHLSAYEYPVALDVGTGCGAIACTLAAELPHALVYAVERSAPALAVATENACSLGLGLGDPEHTRCLCHPEHTRCLCDPEHTRCLCHPEHTRCLCDPEHTRCLCHPERSERSERSRRIAEVIFVEADLLPADAALRFDCVVANLPYIPSADLPKAPDPASFEPRQALDGGPDGLREYRRLLSRLPPHLSEGALLLLEAAPPAIATLLKLALQAFPDSEIAIGTDYAGLERYVRVRMPARTGSLPRMPSRPGTRSC